MYDKIINIYVFYGVFYECGGELVYLIVICVIYFGINVLLFVYKKKILEIYVYVILIKNWYFWY